MFFVTFENASSTSNYTKWVNVRLSLGYAAARLWHLPADWKIIRACKNCFPATNSGVSNFVRILLNRKSSNVKYAWICLFRRLWEWNGKEFLQQCSGRLCKQRSLLTNRPSQWPYIPGIPLLLGPTMGSRVLSSTFSLLFWALHRHLNTFDSNSLF